MTFRILKAYFSCVRSVTSLMLVIDNAVCEAAVRLTMRFVSVTSEDVQGVARVSRDQKLLIRNRTQVINAHRANPKELGEVVPKGAANTARQIIRDEQWPLGNRETDFRVVLQTLEGTTDGWLGAKIFPKGKNPTYSTQVHTKNAKTTSVL